MRSVYFSSRLVAAVVGLAAWLSLATGAARAENWPQWRGPNGNGVSGEKNIPTRWDAKTNVAWRLPLPGPAGASPVVWGDRVFVTSVDGEELVLICASTSGEELWRQIVGKGNKDVRGDEGNFASPSPCTDGRYVWSMMGNGAVGCYDMDGKPVWSLNLQDRYGRFNIAFGMSSTPVLHEDRIYFQLIHGDGKSATQEAMVVALNKLTGEEAWQQARITGATNENEHSYASPILYQDDQRAYLVTHGADYTIAHDLADGREIWRLGGLNPQNDPKKSYHPTLRFVASPAFAPGIIVCPTAKRQAVFAIRADKQGDLTGNAAALLWKKDNGTPDVPSPLIHEGLVYLCGEDGNLTCLDAQTGEQIYLERTHRMRHRSSPVYADGKIYLSARDGRVTVIKAGRNFEILAENEIGEDLSASPAISNGVIYLRTFDALWAIRNK